MFSSENSFNPKPTKLSTDLWMSRKLMCLFSRLQLDRESSITSYCADEFRTSKSGARIAKDTADKDMLIKRKLDCNVFDR